MKTKTLLVDSSYLIKRSFSSAKDTYTNSFGSIGTLYGFMITIRKLIRENQVNKTVLIYDGENGGIARHRLDSEYKSNRKSKSWYNKIELTEAQIKFEEEKDISLLKNKKRIQSYCEELYLRQIEVDEIEADDLIAAYCIKNHEKEDIILFTNDRDFSQLLDLNISIIFGNIDEIITKDNYYFKFNYNYKNALTIKIICGDSADNIHGIEGIQEKTLLKHFPELEYKYISVNEICKKAVEINENRKLSKKKPIKALENLINGKQRLILNYKLINLREPILNENAIEQLEQLDMPLSSEGRDSKNLYKMMIDDDFLSIYNSNFVSFVEPFYSVIMHEKETLNEYLKNNKNNI